MNKFPTQEQVKKIKEQYQIGTKIKLLSMDDPYAPIESGTVGEIVAIDDIGTFTMKWSNGRSLGVVPFEDKFEVISKPEQLQKGKLLSKENVVAGSQNQDYTDKIVVLSPEKLKDECRTSENQLWFATHGPGINKSNSFTGTVHLTHPIDGDTMAVNRNEIIGIAKQEVVEMYLTEQAPTMEIGGMK